jgi:hypothetical protein
MNNIAIRVSFIFYFALAFLSLHGSAQPASTYDGLVQRGNTQLQAGSNDAALTAARAAIKVNADRWEAHAVAGGALLNLKRYEEAADEFSLAIGRAPQAKQAGLRDLRKQCLSAESGASPSASPTPSPSSTTQAEIVLWKTIEHSANIADYQAYLQQYPNGAFAPLAKNRLGDLMAAQSGTIFDEGSTQFRQGNYSAAAESWKLACDSGNANGCTSLGLSYDIGRGVAQDHMQAERLYQKGCDGGNAIACRNLGRSYEKSTSVAPDYMRAAQLYQKGCDGGDALACDYQARLYEVGQGVAQDYTNAAQFYQKACDGGNAHGCASLGHLFDMGQGVARDHTRAAQIFQKGCDTGYALSCWALGYDYENGFGLVKDLARAAQFYQKACDGGNAIACRGLGSLYTNGQGVTQDIQLATQLYQKACKLGDNSACGK